MSVVAFTPALCNACACCGTPTGSLFAPGHDARYKGVLARALAVGGWDAQIPWHACVGTTATVTVQQALDAVGELMQRDWSEKVERSASRIARVPASHSQRRANPVTVAITASDRPVFVPRDFKGEAIEELMRKLAQHPLTGQWGTYRGRPARVQKTRRDEGDSRIDLFVDGAVLELVQPDLWVRDENARNR